ncbi:hypothetical protein BJX70DRAFT_382368 [Aspergillus crustosus]
MDGLWLNNLRVPFEELRCLIIGSLTSVAVVFGTGMKVLGGQRQLTVNLDVLLAGHFLTWEACLIPQVTHSPAPGVSTRHRFCSHAPVQ